MAGVKVTLLREFFANASTMGRPAERIFENANGWTLRFECNTSTLYIVKDDKPTADGSVHRTNIAAFSASGIESVEFV